MAGTHRPFTRRDEDREFVTLCRNCLKPADLDGLIAGDCQETNDDGCEHPVDRLASLVSTAHVYGMYVADAQQDRQKAEERQRLAHDRYMDVFGEAQDLARQIKVADSL